MSSCPPTKVILEQIGRLHAGLLVDGRLRPAGIVEFFLGSVTRTLLHETPVPLLLFH